MTWYDSDHESTVDSRIKSAAEGAGRIVERNVLAVKLAAFYAVMYGVGQGVRGLVHGPNAEAIVAIGNWFVVIFAVCTALLGGLVKLAGAVQRRRYDVA